MKTGYILSSLAAGIAGLYILVAGIDSRATVFAAGNDPNCNTEVAEPNEDILTLQGYRIKIIDASVYGCVEGKWVKGKSLLAKGGKKFDIKKVGNKCELTVFKTGKKHYLPSQFYSGFEVPTFRDIFRTGWNITTLQSPKANTIRKYSLLHQELMNGGKFLDNRIDLDTKIVHSGKKALRFYAVKPDKSTSNVSKSMIENKSLCFGKGDHIWFSAWFYLEQGTPTTLFDFETRRFHGGPGIRLIIRKRTYATLELKFADKPQYAQSKVPLPRKKWFNLTMHLVLSNHDDGIIELWQDGTKILSTTGRTLPTHDTIYHSMEVGITASRREATLLVDDVIVSNKPF